MTQPSQTRNSKFETRNYFNYFTEIEDTFVRRRAKHLFLSSMDWALIESWKEMGVPLHIALRGIERAFDSWEKKPRKRSVKTLLYCQEEVEAQYAEWLESRVGAETGEEAGDERIGAEESESSSAPFSRQAIREHLQAARARLSETRANRCAAVEDDFCETLTRADALLHELQQEVQDTLEPDAQKLENSLTGIERMITESLRATAPADVVVEITTEVKKQLRPYRSHMEPAVYEQTLDNLLLKRLRDHVGVPRLSLFYL